MKIWQRRITASRLVRKKADFAELERINKKFGNAVLAQQNKLFGVLDAPLMRKKAKIGTHLWRSGNVA